MVVLGAILASVGTVDLALELMHEEEMVPQNLVPVGHTIYGNHNNKYVVAGPLATHAQCALEVCPRLNASLACVIGEPRGRFVGHGWVGLYQDPGAADAAGGWDAWASGCSSRFIRWRAGQPQWRGGSPERCAFGTFHKKWSGADDSSEVDSEYGGGIFSASCWSKKPCICEYGETTTGAYSLVADALMAEQAGWRARRKANEKAITFSLLCVCVVIQMGCCCILGVLVQRKAQPPADLDTVDSQIEKVPEKVAEKSPSIDIEVASTAASLCTDIEAVL
jgi:hypothetical protein